MGIVNVTPDSFAESGSRLDTARAVDAALAMEAAGADIVDVGGESTRPGAHPVSAEDECARVLPVVRALGPRLRVPISIDTTKAMVARAALDAGAVIVNDISALRYDAQMCAVLAETGAAAILMHMRGTPQSMYAQASYRDVVAEVAAELRDAVRRAVEGGLDPSSIVVDPGIGFAKLAEHSYGVLARLPELAGALGRPVLVGPSRKSFLQAAIGERPAADRDWGTAAAVTAAVLAGAHIVRVHAVPEMVQVVRVAETIRRQMTSDATRA